MLSILKLINSVLGRKKLSKKQEKNLWRMIAQIYVDQMLADLFKNGNLTSSRVPDEEG